MEYQAVTAPGTTELNEHVNKMIKDGWQPAGGVSITHVSLSVGGKSGEIIYCAQAMVR